MLAYKCKNCEEFTVLGYVNEFEEHFCSEKCYKLHCEKNSYDFHLENLKKVILPL